jgi:hypothetical protein
MATPLVTVVIPAYNMKDDLVKCLNSLYSQSYSDFAAIVINDDSRDGTLEMLGNCFPQVKVITHEVRLGQEACRNKGINKIKSKWFATLDADAELDKRWLEALVEAGEADTNIGMCSCKIFDYYRKNTIDCIGHSLYYDFSPKHIGFGEEDRGQFDKSVDIFGVCLAGSLIKKEVFDKAGFFDEDYGGNFGDDEWGWRARLTGYRCVFVPAAVMYHKRTQSRLLSEKNIIIWERNRILSIIKYYPLSMCAVSLFYAIKRYVLCLMRKKNSSISFGRIIFSLLLGWKEAFLFFPVFIRKRNMNKKLISMFKIKAYLCRRW